MGYVSHGLAVIFWGLVAFLGAVLLAVTICLFLTLLVMLFVAFAVVGYGLSVNRSPAEVMAVTGIIEIGFSWKDLLLYFLAYLCLGVFLLPALRRADDDWIELLLTVFVWPYQLTFIALRNIGRP